MATSEVRNVVIIGSGPAGYTAAIYTARARLKPLMFEGEANLERDADVPGGQLMLTTEVENFPGFEHGIQGPDLMATMRKQALRFETEIRPEYVTKVDFKKRPFEIHTAKGVTLAKAVIISTGAQAKLLGIPEEKSANLGGLMGNGISTCATCDGAFTRDLDVIVVGGGDSAMEEANFLTKFAKTVTIVHRRQEFRASKIMIERAKANPKIKWILDSTIKKVTAKPDKFGRPEVVSATIENVKTRETMEMPVGFVFIAIGHTPNTKVFQGQIDMDENGYILVGKNGRVATATNVDGVFASGDVADHVYRQAITAAGTGCQSALDAERWLTHHGG